MTWLTPLFLAAGLAVAGPILFHMWQRMPRGRRLFSSSMFLAPSPPRITHRSRIENWPLLLLRALALLLLAIGFARPVVRTETQAPAISSPEKTIAVLVDTSASLRRTGFWESLVDQVSARIDALPPDAHLGLFLFDHRWQTVVPFEEADRLDPAARRKIIREQLSHAAPGWGSTRLGFGLAQTVQAVREYQATRPVREAVEIWLASDLASGADLAGLSGLDWPETMTLEPIAPQVPAGSNAGLQWVESRAEDSSHERRVRVSNAAGSKKDRFVIAWETPAGGDSSIEIHVPAGQSRTVVVPERPPEIAESVPLRLTGDDHDFDNRLWAAAGRRRQVWVLYLGKDDADDPSSLRFFLEQVIAGTPEADVSLRDASEASHDAALVDPPVLAVWTDAAVAPPDWFRQVLERGASLLAVPQSPDDARVMLSYLGLAPDSAEEAEVKDYALLSDIDFEDPLFAAFIQAKFADFTGIHFWKHRRVKLPESFSGQVLARFGDGDPFVIRQNQGDGRSWLLTSGWHPADSQLARSSKFAPLLHRMLEQSTPLSAGASRGAVGTAIVWPLSRGSGPIAVQRPDGVVETQADGDASYPNTDLPGIYIAGRNGESASWAIHVAPDESKTDPLPMESLERFGVATRRRDADRQEIASPLEERQLQLAELERRQALWKWCLLGAGLLVLWETAWAARQSRQLESPERDSAGQTG